MNNILTCDFERKVRVLLLSDLHLDHPECDRKMLKKHLEKAKREGAWIALNGDTLCLMQGRNDRRGSKSALRPEHAGANYFDLVAEECADFLMPYAEQLLLVGYGNHETSVVQRYEVDPLRRMWLILQEKGKAPGILSGYGGWLVFRAVVGNQRRAAFKIKHYHGSGGGGVVTKGVIANNRILTTVSGADCYWMGHVHESYHHVEALETLNAGPGGYRVQHQLIHFLRTSSYKDEYRDGKGGWHIETGKPAKPLGGAWLDLEVMRSMDSKAEIKEKWLINPEFRLLNELPTKNNPTSSHRLVLE